MSGDKNGTGIGVYNLQEMQATKKAGDQISRLCTNWPVLLTGPERVTRKHFSDTGHYVFS